MYFYSKMIQRIGKCYLILLVVALGGCSFALPPTDQEVYQFQNYHKEIPKEGVHIHFIPLTNGEATLILLENGEHVLIDSGNYSSQHELFAFLEEQQIEKIEHVIITNDKDEHMGNFRDLLSNYTLNHVYYPYHLDSVFSKLEGIEDQTLHSLSAGDSIKLESLSFIKILHPGKNLELSPQDHSLVFQFIHNKNKFLFTSDISDKVEEILVKNYDLRSQILKVCDFGSNQASSDAFLAEVDAHVAVIFHRPNFYLNYAVLERLEESWMDVYPLKKHGHIHIVSQKNDYELFVIPPAEK